MTAEIAVADMFNELRNKKLRSGNVGIGCFNIYEYFIVASVMFI